MGLGSNGKFNHRYHDLVNSPPFLGPNLGQGYSIPPWVGPMHMVYVYANHICFCRSLIYSTLNHFCWINILFQYEKSADFSTLNPFYDFNIESHFQCWIHFHDSTLNYFLGFHELKQWVISTSKQLLVFNVEMLLCLFS